MKKIAVITYAKLHGLNGLSFYVNNFQESIDYFAERGFDVRVFTDDLPEEYKDAEWSAKEEIQYVNGPLFRIKQKTLKILSHSQIGSRFIFKKAFAEKAKRVIDRNWEELKQADAIVVNDFLCAYFILEKQLNARIIYVMHNDGVLYSQLFSQFPNMAKGRLGCFLHETEERIFNNSDVIIFVSNTAREAFVKRHKALEARCKHIPVCKKDIPCVYEHNYDSEIRIVSTGTVCERKNQLALIQAFEKIPHEKISLTIVGGGPKLEDCRDYVSEKKIQNVFFTGPTDDVSPYLNEANLFVAPSLNEGLPTTGVEALRNGLPIIIGDVGGCRELIEGNGILIDPTNPDELAESILSLVNDSDTLKKMSKQSRLIFEAKYSLDSMINEYIQVINDLLVDIKTSCVLR